MAVVVLSLGFLFEAYRDSSLLDGLKSMNTRASVFYAALLFLVGHGLLGRGAYQALLESRETSQTRLWSIVAVVGAFGAGYPWSTFSFAASQSRDFISSSALRHSSYGPLMFLDILLALYTLHWLQRRLHPDQRRQVWGVLAAAQALFAVSLGLLVLAHLTVDPDTLDMAKTELLTWTGMAAFTALAGLATALSALRFRQADQQVWRTDEDVAPPETAWPRALLAVTLALTLGFAFEVYRGGVGFRELSYEAARNWIRLATVVTLMAHADLAWHARRALFLLQADGATRKLAARSLLVAGFNFGYAACTLGAQYYPPFEERHMRWIYASTFWLLYLLDLGLLLAGITWALRSLKPSLYPRLFGYARTTKILLGIGVASTLILPAGTVLGGVGWLCVVTGLARGSQTYGLWRTALSEPEPEAPLPSL